MYLRLNGEVWEKLCTQCGEWKSVKDEFYTRKSYRVNGDPAVRLPRPACKRCTNLDRGLKYYPNRPQHGLIVYSEISPIVERTIERIGMMEFARRVGISAPNLWRYRTGRNKKISRINAARLLTLCREVIKSGEVKTHNEIWQGTRLNK